MGDITKFYPADAAKNPDNVLEQAVGQCTDVLVLGYDHEGEMFAACSEGLVDGGDMLWLIEQFKAGLMNGEYNSEQ